MTTTIQAAIEALTRYTPGSYAKGMMWSPNGGYFKCADVLAALQAAPAPGSIDTPRFRELLMRVCGAHGKLDVFEIEVAELVAHIAQRAASADEVRYNEDGSTSIFDSEGGVSTFNIPPPAQMPVHDPDAAVPIPYVPAASADEVAGEWVLVPTVPTEKMICAGIEAYFGKCEESYTAMIAARPPAPQASAPDAPAGELLPLPEAFGVLHYNRVSGFSGRLNGYTADQMRAYALADRAARAAAQVEGVLDQRADALIADIDRSEQAARAAVAPAGHAEPVAWANVRESDGVVVGLSQHPEDTARWMNPRALVFAAL